MTGARDYTEAEAKALIAQSGANAIAFKQAETLPTMRMAIDKRCATAFQVCNCYASVIVAVVRFERVVEALAVPAVWIVQQVAHGHAFAA